MPDPPLAPGPTPEALEELLLLAKDARITSYFAVAALTFLVFDYFLSLGHEIEFVWKRRKSHARCIYVQSILCLDHNRIYTQFEGVSSTLVVLTVDIILLLRVWILFDKSPRLLYLMIPLILVEIGVMCVYRARRFKLLNHWQVFYRYIHDKKGGQICPRWVCSHLLPLWRYQQCGRPQLPGCYSLNVPRFFFLYPIPSLLMTSTMFIMTLYNCKKRLQDVVSTSRNNMRFVNLFLRDGIFWFLAVVAVNPPQIILWAIGRPTLTELLIVPSIAVYSIIGSRVLLNIMEIMSVTESDLQSNTV
ncbi:hypothetical protein FB45DRAFT_87634 [Roridomyces roridus]|uniref:DUF6533 domain-containing protein n=1 Tax=Roridomyces roridus TaxID=1738132 RepID=A0AAD7BMK6_9AGAR|nr:hypothetical protein FB45DRAFT_87634 [Roridomyces roridus]